MTDHGKGSALSPSDLRWTCDPQRFDFATTADVPAADLLTHQTRPVQAIKLSLGMRRLDYNVYVSGASGLGKTRTITRIVEEVAAARPVPDDWVYVYDFDNPDRPNVLRMPAGEGRKLAAALQAAMDRLGEDIGQVLHSAPLTRRRQLLVDAFERRREALVSRVQAAATQRGFELNRTLLGPYGLTVGQEEDDLLRPLDPRLRDKRNGELALVGAEDDGPPPEKEKKKRGGRKKKDAAPPPPPAAPDLLPEIAPEAGALTEAAPEAPGLDVSGGGDEKALPAEATDAELLALRERRQEVLDELGEVLWQLQKVSEETNRKMDALQREAAQQAITPILKPLRKTWGEVPEVSEHLNRLKEDILDNLSLFLQDEQEEGAELTGASARDIDPADGLSGSVRRYYANVVIDRTGLTGAPVVAESHPTYANLMGRIEQEAHQGTLSTHFLMIKGGALHRALGGFLILRAEDLLREPTAWEALKRAIRDGEVRLEDPSEGSGTFTTRWLRPEGIPLDGTRIVLTGNEETLEALSEEDLDFPKLFKVVAQFDDAGPLDELLADLPGFVRALCEREGLRHMSPGAVAALAERCVRDAEDRAKLSTRQVVVSDLVREADYWAAERGASVVEAEDVARADAERAARVALTSDRIHETLARGQLKIAVDGAAVGQLNGLVVSQVGPEIAFGWPARITARAGVGDRGVLAIEREVHMSGPIHGKSVLIIEGYLRGRYSRDVPLSAIISVVMEQTYMPIEGDSASAAELVAILSAIGEIPIDQSLATTGAMDQHGRILPIGGVNEKIEGMYRACKLAGLTGRQGVIIPRANVEHLQVRQEVVDAVAAGQFHVWAADDIDEVIARLTGQPAALAHERVAQRMGAFARSWRDARVR